jgi:nucleoid DNA-binding protein
MDKKVWGKTELVDKVAEKTGMTKKNAKAAIEATTEVVKDSVKDGAEIRAPRYLVWV